MKTISWNARLSHTTFFHSGSICVHCGACAGICPSGAFSISGRTFRVELDPSICAMCGLCLQVCCYGAIQPVEDDAKNGVDGI